MVFVKADLQGVSLEACKRQLPSTYQLPAIESTLDKRALIRTGQKWQVLLDASLGGKAWHQEKTQYAGAARAQRYRA